MFSRFSAEGIALNVKRINVLIIDDDIEFAYLCAQELPRISDMFNCEIARDGLDALSKIKTEKYDVIVLDALMPIMDGLGVLNKISELKLDNTPKILAISSCCNANVASAMLEGGADYFMPKPHSINELALRIQFILLSPVFSKHLSNNKINDYNYIPNDDEVFAHLILKKIISKKVLEYGIPTNLLGYNYSVSLLCYMFVFKHSNPTLTQLYENIANDFASDSKCVENAVNTAMKVALRNNTPALKNIMQIANLTNKHSFSNSKFFSLLFFDIEQNVYCFK